MATKKRDQGLADRIAQEVIGDRLRDALGAVSASVARDLLISLDDVAHGAMLSAGGVRVLRQRLVDLVGRIDNLPGCRPSALEVSIAGGR